jgi:hypothetical protein
MKSQYSAVMLLLDSFKLNQKQCNRVERKSVYLFKGQKECLGTLAHTEPKAYSTGGTGNGIKIKICHYFSVYHSSISV